MNPRISRTSKTVVAASIAAALLLAPAARADDPTGATGAIAADPAGPAAIKLSADGAYRYHGRGYVFPKTKLAIRGRVKADLGGQSVDVEIYRHGKLIKRHSVETTTKSGTSTFHLAWRAGNKGKYTIRVAVPDALKPVAEPGKATRVSVVRTNVHYGSHGVSVRLFQHELRQLAYVAPLNGRFDAATGRAFIAYRKVTGMARIPSAGYSVARKLSAGKGRFHLRFPKAGGRHVEVSIRKQVMAFAIGDKVVRIYHVSTGKPSTPTVRGTFHVYSKDWGTNAKGMVDTSYFTGGYGIHGYAEVPTYNASHGCVRVPIPNAASIYNWIHIGTRVDTYY